MKAKKTLGQHFLKSEPALKKIIEAGEVKKGDIILEIGPGRGALTEKLLERAGLVIAVEKDRELFEFLKTKFARAIAGEKLILVNDDILNFDMEQNVLEGTLGRRDGAGQRKFSAENFRGESENILRNYKIIANIPYNITGAILKKFLTARNQPERMVLMVQQEVAKRMLGRRENTSYSKPSHGRKLGKESILSISVKAYGEPKMIMKVPARYFSPAPQVGSAVVAIKNISHQTFIKTGISEEHFWKIIKTGFAHKRKKLSGNLKNVVSCQGPTLTRLGNKRAEDLSLSDWILLAGQE